MNSWKLFLNFKQVDSGSGIMENTIEITVFSIVWQTATEHCLKMLLDLTAVKNE